MQAAKRARTTPTTPTVFPFAGCGIEGHRDGAQMQARLHSPGGISEHAMTNTFFFTDDHCVRLIRDGLLTTLCGSASAGFADGTGSAAQFTDPAGKSLPTPYVCIEMHPNYGLYS